MSRHWEYFNDLEVEPPRFPWLRDILLGTGMGLFLGITLSSRIASGGWNDAVAAFLLFPALVLVAIVGFEQITGRRSWAAFARLVAIALVIVAVTAGVTLLAT